MLRKLYLLGFLISVGSIIAALLLEHIWHLEPCPLCLLSRLVVVSLALLFLIAFLHNPQKVGLRIYAFLGSLISATGIAINIRHVWLQHLPPEKAPACGPGVDYLMQVFPPMQVLSYILKGSGECAQTQMKILGLSLPVLTLALFILLFGLWLFTAIKKG